MSEDYLKQVNKNLEKLVRSIDGLTKEVERLRDDVKNGQKESKKLDQSIQNLTSMIATEIDAVRTTFPIVRNS